MFRMDRQHPAPTGRGPEPVAVHATQGGWNLVTDEQESRGAAWGVGPDDPGRAASCRISANAAGFIRVLRLQIRVEEGDDPSAGVLRGCLVISVSGHELAHDSEHRRRLVPGTLVVVEELVSGFGVLLHVVVDPDLREYLLEPFRRTAQHPILAPIASDDGASPLEEVGRVGVLRGGAVVDA